MKNFSKKDNPKNIKGISPFFSFFSALSALINLIYWFLKSYKGHYGLIYVPFMCPEVPCLEKHLKQGNFGLGHINFLKGHNRALKRWSMCPEKSIDIQELKGFRALRALKNPTLLKNDQK